MVTLPSPSAIRSREGSRFKKRISGISIRYLANRIVVADLGFQVSIPSVVESQPSDATYMDYLSIRMVMVSFVAAKDVPMAFILPPAIVQGYLALTTTQSLYCQATCYAKRHPVARKRQALHNFASACYVFHSSCIILLRLVKVSHGYHWEEPPMGVVEAFHSEHRRWNR